MHDDGVLISPLPYAVWLFGLLSALLRETFAAGTYTDSKSGPHNLRVKRESV